jgi:hypothetical protein
MNGVQKKVYTLEESLVAVLKEEARRKYKSQRAYAMAAFTWLSEDSRERTWQRMYSGNRRVSVDDVDRIASVVGLSFERVLMRARYYQETGCFLKEDI